MSKKISIVMPTYNEKGNIKELIDEIIAIFEEQLTSYDYEIIVSDNSSIDGTKDTIKEICGKNSKVKAIFNAKNFRDGSGANALKYSRGDCTIFMSSDFQDPPMYIPKFVKEWEDGYKIVIGIKKESKTNFFMHFLRTCYYKIINLISDINHIDHFTGFGLYDKSFLDAYNSVEEASPYFRGFVAKYGFKIKKIDFVQPVRKSGVSTNKLKSLYDIAMRGITTYSKFPLRILSFIGVLIVILSLTMLVMTFVLFLENEFIFMYLILDMILFTSGFLIFTIGILGEYIMSINIRTMKFPRVIEEEKINFLEE